MIKKDFENDLRFEIKHISDKIGIKVNSSDKLDKILRDYLTVRFKLIAAKQREIRFSPDLLNNLVNHPQKNVIEHIREVAKKGGNLNIFQSKRLLQSGFHDHLMSEWNIFHFHLSMKLDKKTKFVKQVDSLLFAYIDDRQIIFLGTDKHREGIFADTKWITVLHDYFPDVIEKYKDNEIMEISPQITAEERQTLWNKGYTIGMTKVRDVVYHNPGIGRTTSGHSMSVIQSTNNILRWIYKINKQIDDSINELCEYLNINSERAIFKIRIRDTMELIELTSNIKILDYPQILVEKDKIK